MKVEIEISGRHCHISRKDLDLLYGQGYKLTPIKPLSQTGQFAAKETITLKVGDNELTGIRILGPERKNTQVEITLTEAYKLKIDPPVAECSCPDKPKGCAIAEIIGPKGTVKRCAVIVARRHFHTDPKTAKLFKVKEGQIVSLKTSGFRSVIFNSVLVRIDKSFKPRIHLDTDEGNAAGLKNGDKGEIIL